ncbi:MAG: sodium:calcium antiporter [bacterium]|nr:sodium:calcium antiporter [bacterium]
MIAWWIAVLVIGLAAAILGSSRAVTYASELAYSYPVSPFIIGAVIVAIGTDLPEIANSVVGALAGEGDFAAGNATGSTITQMTLVLGILPLVGGTIAIGRQRIALPGALMVGGLLLGALFGADSSLTRLEGLVLVAFWLASTVLIYRKTPVAGEPTMVAFERRLARAIGGLLAALAVVGVGATAAVTAFLEIAEQLDVPIFLISFFAASIGSSLPELVVDITAVRRGERDLAIGDIFGSSLIDATLVMGIGPALRTLTVDGTLVVTTGIVGAAIVAALTITLARRHHHDWVTGVGLLLIYAALYPLMMSI